MAVHIGCGKGEGGCCVIITKGTCVIDAPMIPFDDLLYKIRAHGVVFLWVCHVTSVYAFISVRDESHFVCLRRQCISTSLRMSIIAAVVQR